MTSRERVALALVLVGAVAVVVAAVAYGGWRAGVAATGVLALTLGVLLGLEGEPAPVSEPAVEQAP